MALPLRGFLFSDVARPVVFAPLLQISFLALRFREVTTPFSVTMGEMPAESTSTTPDGLWIINAQGTTVYANEDMAQILGTTIADLIGKDSFLHVFPEDLDAARQLFAIKQNGDRSPFHFRLRRVDGGEIWTDVQGTPMRNAAGDFIGIVGSFTVSKRQGRA